MDFEEMKTIWNNQDNEPVYVIDKVALHNRILAKKNAARRLINLGELISTFANLVPGLFIIAMNLLNKDDNIYMYILAAWMIASSLAVLLFRIRRKKAARRYDRSMLGDLDYAIATATYQVQLSRLMRWNILPIAILTALGVWDGGKSFWLAAGIILFFVLANYASGWEHRFYEKKKRELEVMRGKMEEG
jgi:hypothetical protein